MPKHIRRIRVEGNIAYVPLTQGYEAVIDAADVPLVEKHNWCVFRNKKNLYAKFTRVTNGGKFTSVLMHRVIMGLPTSIIDHKDGNGLNNCRDNLREATQAENRRNSKISVKNTSGFKGVRRSGNRWHAYIVAGRSIFLGSFSAREDAYAAYCAAAKRLHGDFARLK